MSPSGGHHGERWRSSSLLLGLTGQLMQLLMSEGFRAGSRLPPERELATRLGVGRSSVREALKSLTLLGLIEPRQGVGNYLAPMDPDLVPRLIEWGLELDPKNFEELVEARYTVELAMASLAAARRTEQDLSDMERLLTDMESSQDVSSFVEQDIAFHLAVAAAARNEVLGAVQKSVHSLLRVWIPRAVDHAEGTAVFAQQHRAIYESIKDSDAEGASDAMDRHLASAYDHLVLAFEGDHADPRFLRHGPLVPSRLRSSLLPRTSEVPPPLPDGAPTGAPTVEGP